MNPGFKRALWATVPFLSDHKRPPQLHMDFHYHQLVLLLKRTSVSLAQVMRLSAVLFPQWTLRPKEKLFPHSLWQQYWNWWWSGIRTKYCQTEKFFWTNPTTLDSCTWQRHFRNLTHYCTPLWSVISCFLGRSNLTVWTKLWAFNHSVVIYQFLPDSSRGQMRGTISSHFRPSII